ncbi:MAG TPA: trimethylamine methyltransferase family protein, partial [Candidatus Acidoferrum sp.]|nr:trimethylamine methyltransferase family protein [Candidatus Acidoferrum sp.]
HYLGSDQTLALMQREYIYPAVGDRTSPKEWVEQGRTDIVDKAIKKVREILGSHFPAHVPEAVDAAIRRELPIRLARERMRPAAAGVAAAAQ